MTKQEIIKELNKGKSYTEIGAIAERLIYKLYPLEKEFGWSGKYDYLYREDLEKLGYEVYEVGTSEPEKLKKNLRNKGYLYTNNVFFSLKNKEVWSIKDYMPNASVCMNYKFLSILEKDNLLKLISKKQYIELLADKILEKINRWNKLKNFFNSLVEKEKKFYDYKLEKEKKAKIIKEALEKAREEGLIK